MITEAPGRLVKSQLVIPHAGAAMGKVVRTQPVTQLQAQANNQVAIRTQHRVFAQHPGLTPYQWYDELVPDLLAGIQGVVLTCAEGDGEFLNPAHLVNA